jgi:peptide/nickel transport system substrate-binding protein
MLKSKKWAFVAGILLVSLVLSACQAQTIEVPVTVPPQVQTQIVVQTQEVIQTQIVEQEIIATPVPEVVDRTGTWLDTVIVVEEPSQDAAVSRLLAGDLDIFATGIANAVVAARVAGSPALSSVRNFGLYDELSFNPVGPEFGDGLLNPFSVPAIREAMNWLIDREYIAQELYGGMAIARWTALSPAGSDYARLAEVVKAVEARYSYDMDRAEEVISAEMEKLGATREGGQWMYNGSPVEINLLIRTEDTRRQIGDYVGNQLEAIGFATIRNYRTAGEASPIWFSGDPANGEFHIYTGGWSATVVSRDDGSNFGFFYSPLGQSSPLWQAYEPDPEFYEISERLWNNDFLNLDERRELIAQALDMSMADSTRVWTTHRASITPYRAEVSVASDLFAGVSGGALWAQTLRRTGEVGGSMRVGLPSILTEPWNPVAGSNWLFDAMLYRGTGEFGFMRDPYTGLAWPNRAERAEVVVQDGLPVDRTLDWVSLEFASEISVPDDAWADWDAAEQRFITVGEVDSGRTSLAKITVYYPADLYDTVFWHDGSAISPADFVMGMIITFDRGKEESAIFDQSRVAPLNAFMNAFNGVRIVSTNPLVIETYTDNYDLDAEVSAWGNSWWPQYAQGPGAWHNLGLGVFAEAAGEAVMSQAKSTATGVDRQNYIAGETVGILKNHLDAAAADNMVPYEPTLSEFLGPDEAATRWTNLTEWHRTRGHFWLGTGPFYLERAFPVEGTVILQRNARYPDPADRWDRFAAAAIPEVDVDGPSRVTIGAEATFDVFVEFAGEPYATADIDEVKFLVIDAEGNIAHVGSATAVDDGHWEIVLGSDVTGQLSAGSNRLEAIVVSNRVAMPASEAVLFVTAP